MYCHLPSTLLRIHLISFLRTVVWDKYHALNFTKEKAEVQGGQITCSLTDKCKEELRFESLNLTTVLFCTRHAAVSYDEQNQYIEYIYTLCKDIWIRTLNDGGRSMLQHKLEDQRPEMTERTELASVPQESVCKFQSTWNAASLKLPWHKHSCLTASWMDSIYRTQDTWWYR